jgi:hypothetical protein
MHTDDISQQALRLISSGVSQRNAAAQLGISRAALRRRLETLARHGQSPGMTPARPIDGMFVVKTTVQTDAQGNIVNEWRRWVPGAEEIEQALQSMEERVVGKAPKLPSGPQMLDKDLLLELPIPDHHMGMLSWAKETGSDYNCVTATQLLVNGVRSVLKETPPVGKALLVILGDYYHSDNRSGVTERGGNILDTDSRYTKRLDAGIDAILQSIELCALRAAQVEVLVISGNHDWHSAKWLSRVLASYYRKEKRVHVHLDPGPRQYITHGKVLLGYMHGDTVKASHFARLVPQEAATQWAQTTYRYGRVGHWHHRSTEEYPGIVIETLPTLAAADAWANEHGYLSRRAITSYLWHAKYGLRCKAERSPEEVMAH